MKLAIGCHVSAAGGVWNAPKNAKALECETFQIFTRPPMGGPAPKIDGEAVEKFTGEMKLNELSAFVVHCPYFVNFGSAQKRIYHGSISVVSEELKRADLLGAKYVMTHLGSTKDLGQEKGLKQAREGLEEVLEKYEGKTQFLLEIAAGAGEVIGDTFEELYFLMEPLVKYKTFGGICFDTQHAFSSGYDLRTAEAVSDTFKKFDKAIGLKWLKMSHINDSKVPLSGHKDRHEHIGEGEIGKKGFGALLGYLSNLSSAKKLDTLTPRPLSLGGEGKSSKGIYDVMPLILETEHDKVKSDIKILKTLRDKSQK
jgi:deoxyribonuclease-4